jgi:hypothetical protein
MSLIPIARILLVFALGMPAFYVAAQTPVIPESAYRKSQPEALTAEQQVSVKVTTTPAYSSTVFSTAYRAAGSPAMVILWNREFSDTLVQGSASQLSIDSSRASAAGVIREAGEGWRSSNAASASRSNLTITAQDTKTVQAQRSGPVERVNLQMRSMFVQTIVDAGVKLVDRNLIMRTVANSKTSELDTQSIETSAFIKHAKLLMEVLNTPDTAAATGWATFISVKRLTDGVILMEGYMDGNLPEGADKQMPKFEANPNGGFRQVIAEVKVTDVGARVARQTLGLLSQAMTR